MWTPGTKGLISTMKSSYRVNDWQFVLSLEEKLFSNRIYRILVYFTVFCSSLANAFLCHYKTKWLNDCPKKFKPVFYKRYLDDIFVLFERPEHVKPFVGNNNSNDNNNNNNNNNNKNNNNDNSDNNNNSNNNNNKNSS